MTRVPSPARRPRFLAAAAIVAVLVLSFVLWRRGHESAPGLEGTESIPAATVSAEAPLVFADVPAAETTGSPTLPIEAADTREAPPRGSESPRPPRTKLIVEGRLRVAGTDEVPASLKLKLLSGEKQIERAQSHPDGTFLLARNNTKAELRFGCSVQVSIGQDLLQQFEIDAEEFVRDEGTETWRAHVELELADIWIVRGTLLTPEGKAPQQARLSLVPFNENDAPTLRVRASAESRRDGRFELVAKPEQAQVRLVVQSNGYVPLMREVVLPRSGLVDLGTLTLDRGLTISGCVSSSLPPEYRAESVDVLNLERGITLLPIDTPDRIHWGIGGAFWGHASAPVGNDGCFEIRGLRPGRYVINPSHQGVVSLIQSFTIQVEAPASNVVVHDAGALIHLRPCDDDGNALSEAELSTAWLSLADDRSMPGSTPRLYGHELLRPILVPPGFQFRAALIVDGFLPYGIAVEGLLDGQTVEATARLRKLPKPRTLSIEVLREDGSVVEKASIRVEIDTPDGWIAFGGSESSARFGRHTISDVPATRVRLSLTPDLGDVMKGTDFTGSARIEIDEHSSDELRAVLPSGGLVEISVTDGEDAFVGADFTLLRDGRALTETMFLVLAPHSASSDTGVGPAGPVRNMAPLEAGDYVLRVEHDGFVAQDVPIKIVPKTIQRCSIQLQRAP